MAEQYLFAFYRDGSLFHLHTDCKVFEDWMERSPWLYPAGRCEIVRFVRDNSITRIPATGRSHEVPMPEGFSLIDDGRICRLDDPDCRHPNCDCARHMYEVQTTGRTKAGNDICGI